MTGRKHCWRDHPPWPGARGCGKLGRCLLCGLCGLCWLAARLLGGGPPRLNDRVGAAGKVREVLEHAGVGRRLGRRVWGGRIGFPPPGKRMSPYFRLKLGVVHRVHINLCILLCTRTKHPVLTRPISYPQSPYSAPKYKAQDAAKPPRCCSIYSPRIRRKFKKRFTYQNTCMFCIYKSLQNDTPLCTQHPGYSLTTNAAAPGPPSTVTRERRCTPIHRK